MAYESFAELLAHDAEVFIYDSLESTNQTAKELATNGAKHGTIIITNRQTAGQGQYGRSFFSPDGAGIYMSIILRKAHMPNPVMLTAYAAVTVCEAIEKLTGKKPKIKWINDVFLEGKKICGILTQAATDVNDGSMQYAVVGIGINFSAPDDGYPDDIKNIAGAVFSDEPQKTTRAELAAYVANGMLAMDFSEIEIAKYRGYLLMPWEL